MAGDRAGIGPDARGEPPLGTRAAVGPIGNAYVTGDTASTGATFPVTVEPFRKLQSWGAAFVAKVRVDGRALDYCGYIDGARGAARADVAVDAGGNAYVAGATTTFSFTIASS